MPMAAWMASRGRDREAAENGHGGLENSKGRTEVYHVELLVLSVFDIGRVKRRMYEHYLTEIVI